MNYATQLTIAWLMFAEWWKEAFKSVPEYMLCPGFKEGWVK